MLAHQHDKCLAVLNKDYDYEGYYKPLVKGELREVSVEGEVRNGAYVDGSGASAKVVYARAGNVEDVCDVDDIALIGSHNLENVLPAVTIARELDVKIDAIEEVLKRFKNLPYRLEFVREVKGIQFYNDSYSTTPDTSMAAVDSFEVPTILIAGGYDKGADYEEWALKILTKPSLHTVILMGDTAERMEKALMEAEAKLGEAEGSPTKILRRSRLEEAVVDAFAESDSGGVVVMSPAAASFDMFKNYKERGNEFMSHVRKLK